MFKHIYIAYRTHFIPPFLPATYKHTITRNSINNSKFTYLAIIILRTPFIIEDDIKEFYYRGLKEWKNEQGYLMDTCLTAQDRFKVYMDYFGLEYRD